MCTFTPNFKVGGGDFKSGASKYVMRMSDCPESSLRSKSLASVLFRAFDSDQNARNQTRFVATNSNLFVKMGAKRDRMAGCGKKAETSNFNARKVTTL